jgi:hypothetical protein
VSNFVETTEETPKAPLELVLCDARRGGCGLLQLWHTVEAGFLYRNYWYRSGVNPSMRLALADITANVERLVRLAPGDIILDIGSNDGTLLRSYTTQGLRLVGFEPATNLMPYAQDGTTAVINDFFTIERFQKMFGNVGAQVITSIAMFYDLEDPNTFVADVGACLDPEGIWIIQMSYLPSMLTQNAFDNICHEHLEYYSLLSLRVLLERHKLRIIDVTVNDVNGGSFRVAITHDRNTSIAPPPGAADRMQRLESREKQLHLDDERAYRAFAERVERRKEQVTRFIRAEGAKGKTVYVYGASTKGNTLLQYFQLDHTVIRAASERNPDKWGKRTVGTLIPIISEEQARSERPDYFLVLPWHFLTEFREREKAFFASGGKFIVPLPHFQVLGG